ncbi:MAG: pyruvate formate-lyase-activating protein [Oscillospiraceae bacterium]|nr:pyruvate formate-lyase-activating protein [Oscillospiraceae bacterium]
MNYTLDNNHALVHSIETFGTLDGPGIRFVLFLQGCNLSCKYCHNKDTCSFQAGSVKSLDELLEKMLKFKTYFKTSTGGVTVSGGEPLLQANFVTKLFKKLKENNIHTTLDTNGNLPIKDNIKELLKYTDLVLLDIKHINNEKCIELTGHSNKNTLDFAKFLSDNNIPVWIRQVLIPEITDDTNDLKLLKEFISTLKNVEKIEILPYHKMGAYKWEQLCLEYPLKNIREITKEDVAKAKKILGILEI